MSCHVIAIVRGSNSNLLGNCIAVFYKLNASLTHMARCVPSADLI